MFPSHSVAVSVTMYTVHCEGGFLLSQPIRVIHLLDVVVNSCCDSLLCLFVVVMMCVYLSVCLSQSLIIIDTHELYLCFTLF